jgi:hypothetical protein
LPFCFPPEKLPEQPDWETCVGMSEYPCSGIDKAILKFPLQDRKKSQIVSVNVSAFFLNFVRQLLPDSAFDRHPASLDVSQSRTFRVFSYEAYAAPSVIILRHE